MAPSFKLFKDICVMNFMLSIFIFVDTLFNTWLRVFRIAKKSFPPPRHIFYILCFIKYPIENIVAIRHDIFNWILSF